MAKYVDFKFKGGKSRFTFLDKLASAKKQPTVKVGFPKSLNIRYIKSGKGKQPTVTQVAIWNEYGTIIIPKRPFMELTQIDRRREVYNFQKKAMKYLLKNGGTIEGLLSLFAVKYVGYIQTAITKFDNPPNAASTISRKKGANNPLIDTGLMRQSVTWEIDDGD